MAKHMVVTISTNVDGFTPAGILEEAIDLLKEKQKKMLEDTTISMAITGEVSMVISGKPEEK